ncbi:MAG: hypothetical protein HY547_07465 [Elusimicrobia bacterium]|nr:hypothetical protein [Elusimicrobiota bacterium]
MPLIHEKIIKIEMTTPVQILNRYLTPFAVILVGTGILLSSPSPNISRLSWAILAFNIVFNYATAALAYRRPLTLPKIAFIRVPVNYITNIALFYMLGTSWEPMWLLFALPAIATAIYTDQQQTIQTSISVIIVMLTAYALKGTYDIFEWTKFSVYAAFIIFLSLFIQKMRQADKAK